MAEINMKKLKVFEGSGIDTDPYKYNIMENADILTLEQLREKYPEITFTMNKKSEGIGIGRYFVRADIKTQDGNDKYLGALKGYVDEQEGLNFLNNIAKENYDKYY